MSAATTLLPWTAIRIAGADRAAFLQGLISNDVAALGPGAAQYQTLLTPQGKFLHDFFLYHAGDSLILLIRAEEAEALTKRLSRFKLRSDVTFEPLDWRVSVAWDGAEAAAPEGGIAFSDPRLAGFAVWRAGPEVDATADEAAFAAHRLRHGIPAPPVDIEPERSILLECNLDRLNAISWYKGCYMGQELTARTHYRGLIKKRLVPVRIDGAAPLPGTEVSAGETRLGEMRSAAAGYGLALLRLKELAAAMAAGTPIRSGEASLTPHDPGWFNLDSLLTERSS